MNGLQYLTYPLRRTTVLVVNKENSPVNGQIFAVPQQTTQGFKITAD